VLHAVAEALAKARQAEQALEAAQQIEDAYLRVKVLPLQMSDASISHAAQQIEDAYLRFKASASISKCQARARLYDEAFRTAQLIPDPEMRNRALNTITELAEGAFITAERSKQDQEAFPPVLQEDALPPPQQAHADTEPNESVLERAASEPTKLLPSSERGDVSEHSEALRIVEARIREGAFTEALQAAQQIESVSERFSALHTISEALVQAERTAEAQTSLVSARQAALLIENPHSQGEALLAIARLQAQAGLYLDALQTALLMESEQRRIEALVSIAEAQARAELYGEAVRTALLIGESRQQSAVLFAIAEAQRQAELYDDARDTAQKIGEVRYRSAALFAIAKAQARAGHGEDARSTAELIEDAQARTVALLMIDSAQAEASS